MKPIALCAAAMMAAACGDPSDDLYIAVTAPPSGGATADQSYIIQWVVEADDWQDPRVALYADTDTDPSTGLILLVDSLSIESTGWMWDCSEFPENEYYIRAVLTQGGEERCDYSDGTLVVSHSPLGNVQGLRLDEDACSGTTVTLEWDPLPGAQGYRVYFAADSAGSLLLLGETVDLLYVHDAPGAGAYGVTGFTGESESPGFDTLASTMPVLNDTVYTIWDDMAPAGAVHAASLTPCGSYLYDYADSLYNIHCRQAGGQPEPAWLFAGDAPPLGNGWSSPLAGASAPWSVAPSGGYSDSVAVEPGTVLFVSLADQGFYAKVLVDDVPTHPSAPGSRGVGFHFEFQQIPGLRLFTTAGE
ncbi:hypothetical protein GX411_10585 [Candidatus Fermentibacteria bacterium]|nr:hypothetical protein [Candidatus Fermentibacteria bacterium]